MEMKKKLGVGTQVCQDAKLQKSLAALFWYLLFEN